MKNIYFKIASNKKILNWSNGEVKNSETLNYRTLKPEFEGLFCERIFGPCNDYECYCKKYVGKIFKNKKCEICGVEIIKSSSRRIRMGHIKLNTLLVNSVYHKIFPSKLSIILDIPSSNLDKIIYSENFVIIKKISKYKKYEIINNEKYDELSMEFGDSLFCKSGGEGVLELLNNINLKKIYKIEKKKIFLRKKNKKNNILRFEIIKSLIKNKIKLSNLVLKNIPVLPPGIRPLLELENGKFASSDLNELYRRLINRNNRIKNISSSFFSENIIIREKKMLQESLDSLFCLGDSYNNFHKNYNKSLKSILENLKGKSGRFRQNLLGKRVDYSARSVIVSEPKLKINQCYIPFDILFEIFRPFIIGKLIKKKYVKTIRKAKKMFLSKSNLVIRVLKNIVKKFKIILNRAPTLHRLGIQSFNIKITKEKAIKIHPLVCFSYNADFDGDQMAVHLPISEEANLEAKFLLNSERNIFFSSNGSFSLFPNQEMVLGLYLLTKRSSISKKIRYYSNINIIVNEIELNNFLYNDSLFLINNEKKYFTTYGRVYIYKKISKDVSISFKDINRSFKKSTIIKILFIIYKLNGKIKTLKVIEKFMRLGFEFCTKLGFSISLEDTKVHKRKKKILKKVFKKNYKIYKKNSLNFSYENFYKTWLYSFKKINFINICKIKKNPFNDILVSGAKSNITQIKQIFSFKGIIKKKNMNLPIFSSFSDGLDTYQYFLSTHSAREGIVDTSLKTADTGYLTRRLINLCQGLLISKQDCKTKIGLEMNFYKCSIKSIIGRFSVKNIYHKNKKVINKNNPINKEDIKKLQRIYIESFTIRSPIFCNVKYGICAKCYGIDLSCNKLVNIGEAVGIIAAQSIGEPGTQFTMRTFHIGGMLGEKKELFYKYSLNNGYVRYSQNLKVINNKYNNIIVLENSKIFITDKKDNILQTIKLKYGDKIFYKNGSKIKKKIIVSESLRFIKVIFIATRFYKFNLKKIKKFSLYKKKKINKKIYLIKIIKTKKKFKLKIYNKDEKISFNIKKNYYIYCRKNLKILKGDIFIIKEKENKYIDNITSGIEKIENILEVRIPKEKSIISKFSGLFKIVNEEKKIVKIGKKKIKVKGKIIKKNNDIIYRGDKITKGDIELLEILKIKNLSFFSCLMIKKIQDIYIEQGININNIHFEIVIKQMLSKVIVCKNINKKIYKEKKIYRYKIIKYLKKYCNFSYKNIIEGITKVSVNNNTSFIASASFQETGKIISETSLLCKKDKLKGLKENIITGNLIPVGTGFFKKIFDNEYKSTNKKKEKKKKKKEK
ncbi:DNA-directed RNA polymerase subunit beta' [Candidatus Vidania fulgoroideae]|nr:DNA-directed RNA polymerase subunit beta' [Candidatus Vidania fulgoroideae]